MRAQAADVHAFYESTGWLILLGADMPVNINNMPAPLPPVPAMVAATAATAAATAATVPSTLDDTPIRLTFTQPGSLGIKFYDVSNTGERARRTLMENVGPV